MRTRILVTFIGWLVAVSAPAHAGVVNRGFESGDLTGWTLFTTTNGTLGGLGEVCLFDVDGDGLDSYAARFRVAELVYSHPVHEGGGIYQQVKTGSGALDISVAIASWTPYGNRSGGLFELLFDGQVVASHDFGPILLGDVERARLAASLDVTGGMHDLRVRMTRPWAHDAYTPVQFVDDVYLSGAATQHAPEPGTLTLLGCGLIGLERVRRRRRRAPHP